MAGAPQLRPLLHNVKQETSNKTRSLSDLPDEVLVVLMQHVPLQQRLHGCARLSTKFRKAAAAATTSIKHHASSMGTVFGLQAYLQSHGNVVVSFDLKPPLTPLQRLPYSMQQLPCPGLLKLRLTDTFVQLTAIPGSQQPGILSSCTALTSLCLQNCNVLDPSHQLGGLSVLQNLQELAVRWDADSSRSACQPLRLSLLPGSLLSQLVRLSSVYLSSTMRFASLEHLSCLTDLQEFRVALDAGANQEDFTGLQQLQRLTSLSLDFHHSQQSIGLCLTHTPDLHRLTSLQEIDVWECKAFAPAVLNLMSSLRNLAIRRTSLSGEARGTSSLLQVLQGLTAVTQLDLSGTLQHPAVQLEDYTALACLSNLGVLVLSHCCLPAGLWQQLAETNMPMRRVWSLNIDLCTAEPLDTYGLSSLVKCFPSLVGLSCVQSTQVDIQWKPLQQLLHMQALHISGVRDADAPVLASLQGLTTLKVMGPSSITDLGLVRLTALYQLEHLYILGHLSDGLLNSKPGQRTIQITNKASAGQVPDVAKQLVRLCYENSNCKTVLLGQLEELLDVRAAAQMVADREAMVRAKEIAAAKQEKQLAEHQTSMEAMFKIKEAALQERNQKAKYLERKTAAAVAEVEASKAECAERWRQVQAQELAADHLEQQLKSQREVLRLQTQQERDRQLRLEASLKAREQQLQLQARSDSAAIVQRNADVASAAARVSDRELRCAEESLQLDRRLQAITAREQHVAAAQEQLNASLYSLHQHQQQLQQTQQALAAQAMMQAQVQQRHATPMQQYAVHAQQPVMQQPHPMQQQQGVHLQPAMMQQQQVMQTAQQVMPAAAQWYGYNSTHGR